MFPLALQCPQIDVVFVTCFCAIVRMPDGNFLAVFKLDGFLDDSRQASTTCGARILEVRMPAQSEHRIYPDQRLVHEASGERSSNHIIYSFRARWPGIRAAFTRGVLSGFLAGGSATAGLSTTLAGAESELDFTSFCRR